MKAVFGSGKNKVAGCIVTSGKLQRAFMTVRRGKQVRARGGARREGGGRTCGGCCTPGCGGGLQTCRSGAMLVRLKKGLRSELLPIALKQL